jgi:membrane protease YdiL (CAAX protease family)
LYTTVVVCGILPLMAGCRPCWLRIIPPESKGKPVTLRETRATDRPLSRFQWATAVGFTLCFPTVLTFAYFVWLADRSPGIQQSVYTVGKIVQFAFPAIWVYFVLRRKPSWPSRDRRGIGFGLAFGVFVVAGMLALYYGWLKPAGHLVGLEDTVHAKVSDLGLLSLWKYVAVGVFYSLVHSFLEEYYWRWFVFAQLRKRISLPWAIAISSLGFMAHHVIVLGTFFGWTSPLAYLFSAGVAIGGVVWAWIYDRSGSLLGPWLSHMLVDAGIFLIGYDLVRQYLS